MEQITDDQMSEMLIAVEEEVSQHGWDQDPFLAVLDKVTPDLLGLAPIPVAIKNPPGLFVGIAGQLFDQDPAGAQLTLERHPGFAGMAFIYEGWRSKEKMTREQRRQLNRPLADIMGSQEIRMVNIVDRWGRAYVINRIRGGEPEVLRRGDKDFELVGRVALGLTMMTRAVVREQGDFAGLAALNETLAAIEKAREARA